MYQLIRSFINGVFVFVLGFAIASPVHANGQASWGPINSAGDLDAVSVDDGSIIDINPARNTISTDAGFDAISSINVDTTTGVIKGYVEYDLANPQTYSNIAEAGSSSAGGGVTLDTFLTGPADPGAPDTIDVTVEMSLHGSFVINSGSPTLLFAGDLALTTFDALALPISGTIYQSAFSFHSPAIGMPGADVDTTFGSSVAEFLGPSMDYAGASVELISAELDNLEAILRLTAPVSVGDSFLLTGFVIGGAGPSPDPADTDMNDGVDVLASAGAVDFSNTASIRILLPDGYSFSGADPLLDNIVVAAPVPLPAPLYLMFAACAMLVRRKIVLER